MTEPAVEADGAAHDVKIAEIRNSTIMNINRDRFIKDTSVFLCPEKQMRIQPLARQKWQKGDEHTKIDAYHQMNSGK